MIERIRERLFIRHKKSVPEKHIRTALHGCAHNIIVVKAPNDIFTEAIFILRDDYYSSSPLSSDELLREARAAAGVCADSAAVRERWKMILIVVLSALLLIETLGMII